MTADGMQDTDQDLAQNAASGLVWRSPRTAVSPRFLRAVALVAVWSLVWFATELVWPQRTLVLPEFPELEAGANAPPQPVRPGAVELSESLFAARKLFIPEVPVASQDTSRAVVDEMLSRLTLTAVVEENGEFVAWVRVGGASERGPGRFASASPSTTGGTRTERVRKGDHLLDFTVEDVTRDSVELKVADFTAILSF